MSLKWRALFVAFASLIAIESKAGGGMSLSLLDPNVLAGAIPDNVALAAVKTFGIYFAHRPYEGAVPIFNDNSFMIKMEVNLIKIGSQVNDALTANGMASNTSSNTLALPIAKLHVRKALGPSMDMGASWFDFLGIYTLGFDLKIELSNPEEGISTALRLGYSYASASRLYLKSVRAYTPEFLISRKLDSAEPYLGFGARYIDGTVSMTFDKPLLPQVTVTKSGTAYTAFAFTGVNFQILGPKGIRFGMEGAYDMSGFSSLGLNFGIGL